MKKILKINFKLFLFLFFIFNIVFINKSLSQSSFTTIDLDINWQVLNSYTPLFYEGKPLISEESDIKAVAVVKLTTPLGDLNTSKFFYDWYINGLASYKYSKTGGDTIIFKLDNTKKENILELKVFENNLQENLLATKIIKIKPTQVKPILYKKTENTLLTYGNAINKKYKEYYIKKDDTFDILAEPFFYSSIDGKKDLSFVWSLNNIPGNKNYTNIFNYSSPKSFNTNTGIKVEIEHESKIYQSGETTVRFMQK